MHVVNLRLRASLGEGLRPSEQQQAGVRDAFATHRFEATQEGQVIKLEQLRLRALAAQDRASAGNLDQIQVGERDACSRLAAPVHRAGRDAHTRHRGRIERHAILADALLVETVCGPVGRCLALRHTDDEQLARSCTKAGMISMFTRTALSLRNTLESIATPCSVNA